MTNSSHNKLTRTFYSLAMISSIVMVVVNILHLKLTWGFSIGFQALITYNPQVLFSFIGFFFLVNFIINIKYLFEKRHYLSFITLVLVAISTLIHLILVYLITDHIVKFSHAQYALITQINYGLILLFGTSLLLSKAKRKSWLTLYGILNSITTIILFFSFNSGIYSDPFSLDIMNLFKLNWYINTLCPLLFFFNFKKEYYLVNKENNELIDRY